MKVKFSPRGYGCVILFALMLLFFIIVGPRLLFEEVIYAEDGSELGIEFKVALGVVLTIVSGGIARMLWIMLGAISRRGYMTLTERGIEDTFVIYQIFAFWTAFRVRCIPWDAVRYREQNGTVCLAVDTEKMTGKHAGRFARMVLKSSGFCPVKGFGTMDRESFEQYYEKYGISGEKTGNEEAADTI